jgi:hypothetical protein
MPWLIVDLHPFIKALVDCFHFGNLDTADSHIYWLTNLWFVVSPPSYKKDYLACPFACFSSTNLFPPCQNEIVGCQLAVVPVMFQVCSLH